MNINELKQQINRVIGVKGDLRIQAWWMNKILNDILVYCDERDNSKDILDVKAFFLNELKNLETTLVEPIGKSENDLNERIDLLESKELFKIVDSLPEVGENNIIYLIINDNHESRNILSEYIYINDSWEKFGDVTIKTPDWNAQEGEDGYIENKTHYYDISPVTNYSLAGRSVYALNIKNTHNKLYFDCLENNVLTNVEIEISSITDKMYTTPNGVYTFTLQNNNNTVLLSTAFAPVLILNDIKLKSSGVKQLADEFIPNTIARVDNIPNSIGTGVGSLVQTKEVETFENKNTNASITDKELKVDALGDNSVVLNGKSYAGAKRSLAHGNGTITLGENSHAEGSNTTTGGENSHTEGCLTTAIGDNSHAEGSWTTAKGEDSHAEGTYTRANGEGSHTEGHNTRTEGISSHAEGRNTVALGNGSHAEGAGTVANGSYSHAEGISTNDVDINNDDTVDTILQKWINNKFSLAYGRGSHVEGLDNLALGLNSHAEGYLTTAAGPNSHAEGIATKTNPNVDGQHVEGRYNDVETDAIKVIGCGTDGGQRCNAVEVGQDGKVFIKNVGGFSGQSRQSENPTDLATIIESLTPYYTSFTISDLESWVGLSAQSIQEQGLQNAILNKRSIRIPFDTVENKGYVTCISCEIDGLIYLKAFQRNKLYSIEVNITGSEATVQSNSLFS